MRTTQYADVPAERRHAAFAALPIVDVTNEPAGRRQRAKTVPAAAPPWPVEAADRHSELYQRVLLLAACN